MKQLLIFLIALLASFGPIQAQEDTSEVKIYNKPMDDKESKSYRPKPVKTRYFMVDFGVSALHTEQSYTLENGIDPFEMRLLKSNNINLHLIQQRFSLVRGYLNFVYGLTLDYNKYFFDNPVVLLEDTPQVTFDYRPDVSFKKNRLSYTYLTLPFMFNIKTNPRHSYRSFHLSAGGYAGLLLGSNFKTKTRGDKTKTRDNFNLNPWRYGLRAEVGYGPLIFYGQYALNELFDEDKNGGYEATPFSVGIVLWPF